MISRALVFFLCFFWFSPIFAEYRIYKLLILNEAKGTSRSVLSILDPDQYIGYYPLQGGEAVYLETSWMCKGRTDGLRKPCSNPESPEIPSEKTISEDEASDLP